MSLYEEAEKISLAGLEVYRFGFFVMLGMLAAAGVIGFLCWAKRVRKGTGPLLMLSAILLGGLFSRLGFCLMNQELGEMMPLASWEWITGGGWSMAGLVGGVLLAAWMTARITRQKAGLTLDIAACAIPAFLALERAGEGGSMDFDFSRELTTTFLNGTFLTFADEYGAYHLATWRLAAILMLILVPVLIADLTRSRRDGDTFLLFLLLFGFLTVMLESQRCDRFLSVHFVRLEQVLAAVTLAAGLIVLAVRADRRRKRLGIAAVVSVFLAAGIVVGLEFALDRTTASKVLLYVAYFGVMAVPTVLGLLLRRAEKR